MRRLYHRTRMLIHQARAIVVKVHSRSGKHRQAGKQQRTGAQKLEVKPQTNATEHTHVLHVDLGRPARYPLTSFGARENAILMLLCHFIRRPLKGIADQITDGRVARLIGR